MREKRIFIVEDELGILDIAAEFLRNKGFQVFCFSNGKSFFEEIEEQSPDIILLDLRLPDMHGFDICRRLKADSRYSSIPIIILSGQGEGISKITGLDLGADDYMVKPVSLTELNSRIKAVLRRQSPEVEEKIIKIGDIISIDMQKYEVHVKGQKIVLTQAEFKILCCLSSRVGNVFSREKLLEHLWGDEKVVVLRTIDVHIKHLREKMGDAADLIQNVRGIGYKLELNK